MEDTAGLQSNPIESNRLGVQGESESLKLCETASNASSLDILSTFKSPALTVAMDPKASNIAPSPSFAENDRRESSTVLDQSHVERVSSFVRRHRQESISLSSGKKRLSWLSLSGTESLKPDTLSRAHSRNYSTGGQMMPFEGRSPKHQNLQTASSLLSASPYLATSKISSSPAQDFQFPLAVDDSSEPHELNRERDEESADERPSKSPIETELLTLPKRPTCMTLDPKDFARALFEGSDDLALKESPAHTLGRKDEFHSLALQAYLDNFDFENLTLDRAFHKVCEKLDFVGETQVMDRILFQIARRHWDCNPRSRNFFRTIDIAYGILFSLVLLNTDLHIANVGEKEVNQMNKKQFVRNTMDLIESMLKNDVTAQKSWNSSQEKKAWKKNLEIELKKLYEIIRASSLFQKDSPTSETRTSITSDDASSIARTSSTWSLSSGLSSGSVFSSASSTARSKRSPFGILKRTFFRPGTSMRLSNSAEKVNVLVNPSIGREIIFQGELIRKHLFERRNVKAKNRRWYKFWSILVVSSEGLDLVMNSTDSKKNRLNYSEGSIFSAASSSSPTSAHLSTGFLSRSSSERFSLLHSISKTLRPMSYSTKRPFVFQLTLSNGSVYLFHVQSNQVMEEWVRHFNYHAARKSKEPLRDVLSSTDYGWNKIEWSRKKAEIDNMPVESPTPLDSTDKVELGTWEPPSSSFTPVLEAQAAKFRNEIEVIQKEMSAHDSYKEPIGVVFRNSSWLEKALSNWEAKRKYLESELHKYKVYVESLTVTSTKSNNASGLDLVDEVEDPA